jgi:cell division protein YceG involved in septum cleavage
MNFDKKKAYPATVHNELILNKEYVLIGRGIYALAQWGYRPGVVSDVIEHIIKNSKRPLTKEEIIREVLKQRMVGKSTVYLSLMNKNKFKRLKNGTYTLNKENTKSLEFRKKQ